MRSLSEGKWFRRGKGGVSQGLTGLLALLDYGLYLVQGVLRDMVWMEWMDGWIIATMVVSFVYKVTLSYLHRQIFPVSPTFS